MIENTWVVAVTDRGRFSRGSVYLVVETMFGAIRLANHEGWFPESWFVTEGEYLNTTQTELDQRLNEGTPMDSSKSRYLVRFKEYTDRMFETTQKKNHDYTGSSDDPFANFRAVERLGICSTVQGVLVRMTDKLSRVTSFEQKGVLQVADESVEDTLLDLATYSLLLASFIREEKERERGKENADSSNGDEIPF